MRVDLGGAIVAAATPFDSAGDVDVAAFQSNLRSWIDAGAHGVLVGGSTAEAVMLEDDERAALLHAAREVVPEGRVLLAGTGAESTRRTIALTAAAAAAGADIALVQPPAFYRPAMTEAALLGHYFRVADIAPIPIAVYQVPPRFSTIELGTPLVAELSKHDNIVGIKDSRGDLDTVAALVGAAAPGFSVLVGSGAQIQPALDLGATGGILGVANLAAGECQDIVRLWKQGRREEAEALQARIAPLHSTVIGGLGIAGVKAGLEMIGLEGGLPRQPLLPLDDEGREKVRAALEQAGIATASRTAA